MEMLLEEPDDAACSKPGEVVETELVRRCLSGEWREYRLLVERYRRLVWAAVDTVTSDKAAVPEVVHEVFIRAYQKLHLFGFRSSFASWLYRLARNHALSAARAAGRRPVQLLDPHDLAAVQQSAAVGASALEQRYFETERSRALRRMLGELPVLDFATYVGVRDAFLDGDLALAECAARLEQLELTPAERREWDRLVAVEDELARLVETAGDLPWTALRVENELQQRVRAAQWLRQNPRGVLGIGGLGSNGTELRRGLVQAGVAAGGASCAMLCCCLVLQVCLPPGPQPGALTLAAGLGGLLALAALRWAELRSYYTS